MSSDSSVIKRVCLEAKAGSPAVKYRIQLLDESLIDESVEFLAKELLPSTKGYMAIISSLGFLSDKDACGEIKSVLRKHFCEGISLAALLEEDSGNCGPLIGCNVLFKESTSEREYRTDKMKLFYQTWADLKKGVDVLKTFNCSDFINSCGLSVASDFRAQGIATELLRARAQVCRLTNIPVTANVFSGPYSHKAAAKAGFRTLSELDLNTYLIDNRAVFPEARGWPTAKYMANKYF